MRKKLFCEIVGVTKRGSLLNYKYRVYDEDNNTIASAVSSSKHWVKHDAGGYHTKEKFDKKYPQGWEVTFDFD